MAFLYLNNKGVPQKRHSYSAGLDFDGCPYRYYLRRVVGWKESDLKAAFKFGRAFEESLQHHHDWGRGAVDDFIRRWSEHKENKELKYTKKEKDWDNLNKIGIDMIRLYEIIQPSLPIPVGGQSLFQREYEKEMYPDDPNYGEITVFGKIDIISYVDSQHPMLPKIDWKLEYGLRPLIVDIKTSGVNYHERPGSAAFDTQLCLYSFLTGIRTVALLWFTKVGFKMEKGSSVTLLKDTEVYKAGEEFVVAKVDGDTVWVVKNDFMLEQMNEAQGKKPDGKTDQTNLAKEKAFQWLKINGTAVPAADLTRQRLQFNSGLVSQEAALNAGRLAGNQIQQIVNSWKSNNWINKFSNRPGFGYFKDPYFQAFVENDTMFRDQNFKKSDDETLDDLFVEPEETKE
jgi:hypothetical protein